MTLQRDVDYDLVYYLRRTRPSFPGVSVQRVYVRNYPDGTWPRNPRLRRRGHRATQLKEPRYQGAAAGRPGRPGRGREHLRRVLRGSNGTTRVQVDAAGQPTGGVLSRDAAPARRQPAADASTRRCRRPGEAALDVVRPARRLRGDERRQTARSSASAPRPTFDPSIFTKPVIPPAPVQAAHLATRPARRSPTARSRASTRRARRSSRSPRSRRSRAACSPRPRRSSTAGSFTEGGHHAAQRRRRRLRRAPAAAGAPGLLRRLLLQRRRRCSTAHGNGAQQKWASDARDRPPDRDRPSRRGRRAAADAGVAQPALQGAQHRPAVDRRATTSTSRSARATSRPTRCRWRSPTRRSPTAATSCARTSGIEVEDPQRPGGAGDRPGAAAPPRHQPAVPPGDPRGPPHGRAGAGRDLVPGLRQLPDPDGRQDRHRAAPGPGGPVLVRGAGARIRTRRSSSR